MIVLEELHVVSAWHSNFGYVQDEQGNYTDRHKGYAYGYRCVEQPRFSYEVRHSTLDDGGWSTVYMVDGVECEYDAIVGLLEQPPKLSLVELYLYLRMEDKTLPWLSLVDYVAGCEQPEPHYIDRKTRWGKVYGVMEDLREKGMIDMENGIARRRDA